MCRKSGKDLRKEYVKIKTKHNALCARTVKRAKELAKEFPNVKYGITPKTVEEILENEFPVVDILTALNVIECIEKHNADNSGIVQAEIKFE